MFDPSGVAGYTACKIRLLANIDKMNRQKRIVFILAEKIRNESTSQDLRLHPAYAAGIRM
jgi:hypothetical protein